MKKIAIITSHCIQYQAPLFRSIAENADVDLTVFFGSDHGLNCEKVDPGFGKAFAWDVPLLEGYQHVFLKNSRPDRDVNDFFLDAPDLKFHLKSGSYDAIVIFGWNNVLFLQAIYWATKFSIPLILRAESNLQHFQAPYVKAAKRFLFPALFKKFSKFLAIGTHNARLYEHYGVPKEKISIAPYCVDNEYFSNLAKAKKEIAKQIRVKLNIKDSGTVFLYVAKFINRKRPLDIIQAALNNGDENAHFILVGDGFLLEECKQFVSQNNVKNINFVGFLNQSEIPAYYAAADVFVLPSHYETWGLVLNEAMASGLPGIVSNTCGAAVDMIKEGVTGYTYPMGDVDELARLFKKFTDSPGLNKQLGLDAGLHVEKFSLAETIRALRDCLDLESDKA